MRDFHTEIPWAEVARFRGRDRELALLQQVFQGHPFVVAVHGIGGIGKSTLLDVFAARAHISGATVLALDGRAIEPTERGFLCGLEKIIGGKLHTAKEAAQRVGSIGPRVVLMVDSYELLRLLDTWIRRVFVELVPDNVRLILAGRDPPVAAWFERFGWEGRFQALRLGPLEKSVALNILFSAGIPGDAAKRIFRITRGHPLALRLAASAVSAWNDRSEDPERVASQRVVEGLAKLYLAGIKDALTREAIEASSVTRRMTMSLLQAVLPSRAPQDTFARLDALPFVRLAPDGLYMHDLVRDTIATQLRSRNPTAHRAYRRAAWEQLRAEIANAGLESLWRYTADLLFLIENPVVREAFFPSDEIAYALEPATTADVDAIRSIAARHESPKGLTICERWLTHSLSSFNVARATNGHIHGFYIMCEAASLDAQLVAADPVADQWQRHLSDHPIQSGEKALLLRRWLSVQDGELPGAVQAACWLDIKRTYIEMRPRLRRVYLGLRAYSAYVQVAQRLFFTAIPNHTVLIDGVEHYSAMLDFGPRSVDGWLARLASDELGMKDDGILDIDSHELILNDERVPLTRLEFKTLHYLYERPGKNVARDELLDEVWGYNYQGESNLVDVVIRSLRKKLGAHAKSVQTVRGIGYRYRDA